MYRPRPSVPPTIVPPPELTNHRRPPNSAADAGGEAVKDRSITSPIPKRVRLRPAKLSRGVKTPVIETTLTVAVRLVEPHATVTLFVPEAVHFDAKLAPSPVAGVPGGLVLHLALLSALPCAEKRWTTPTGMATTAGAIPVMTQTGGRGLGDGLAAGKNSVSCSRGAGGCNEGQARPNRSAYQNSSRTRRPCKYDRSWSALGRSCSKRCQARAHTPSGWSTRPPGFRWRQAVSHSAHTPCVNTFQAIRT